MQSCSPNNRFSVEHPSKLFSNVSVSVRILFAEIVTFCRQASPLQQYHQAHVLYKFSGIPILPESGQQGSMLSLYVEFGPRHDRLEAAIRVYGCASGDCPLCVGLPVCLATSMTSLCCALSIQVVGRKKEFNNNNPAISSTPFEARSKAKVSCSRGIGGSDGSDGVATMITERESAPNECSPRPWGKWPNHM